VVTAIDSVLGVDNPLLPGGEIQGNVIPGFNKDHVRLLFLRIDDPGAAKRWIKRICPYIATAEEVWDFNRLFKQTKSRRGFEGTVKATWVNIAFSYGGLKKLVGEEVKRFIDEAFRDSVSRSDADWVIGGPGGEVDVVVIIAADDLVDLDATARRVRDDIYARDRDTTGGVCVVFEQGGGTRDGVMAGREHFGWLDGVSQPGLRGRWSGTPGDLLTPRAADDPDQGLPGQDLIWPGEFVFGYQGQDRNNATAPGPDSLKSGGKLIAPEWAKDGSYLVFRRLRQDVGAFHRFLRDKGHNLRVDPEALGARLVGRWRSGAPLVVSPEHDDLELGKDVRANNDFEYGPGDDEVPQDPDGRKCPFSAHIRKAYPRDETVAAGDPDPYLNLRPKRTLNESDTQTHRLLRRGIPYGPSSNSTPDKPEDDAIDRGLLFMAYMTSITDQFEFASKQWLNDEDFKRPATGVDPILGQVAGTDERGTINTVLPNETNTVQIGLAKWVTTTGGGYFFAPSITALRTISQPDTPMPTAAETPSRPTPGRVRS
jgi:Dyp-type peroxidase family